MKTLTFTLDAAVEVVLHRLRRAGYSAYPVGGCVRDLLLGKRFRDWDVATSARPEQVLSLFSRAYATGIRHGTITVVEGAAPIEVTTFRTEGAYSDGRRPDCVHFTDQLSEDLSRRDFTINAMAIDENGWIIDPFGGQEDLKNRVVRCVGDPSVRFSEDALRMWRALRLSATLGFSLERHTWDAIVAQAPLCRRLSAERVASEVGKMLLSRGVARLSDALLLGLMDAFPVARPQQRPDLRFLMKLPHRADCRWAGLAAVLGCAGLLENAKPFLRSLRLPNRVVDPASFGAQWAVENIKNGIAPGSGLPTDAAWRRMAWRHGVSGAFCAASASDALAGKPLFVSDLRRVLAQKPCLAVKDLALDGSWLKQAGYEGEAIGEVLRRLLEHVLEYPEDNTEECLKRRI